jgi:hypothetical protein
MNSYNECKTIVELDLDPIKVKLMHKESGEGWTLQQAITAEAEYRRFLYLIKMFPDETIAPRADVDIFWHYHILDTRKYAHDCQELFGYFLHHFPYLGLGGEDDHQRVGERTGVLYEQTFGDSYLGEGQSVATATAAFCSETTAAAFCSVSTATAFCSDTTRNAFCSVTTATARSTAPAFCSVATAAARSTAPAFCSVATAAVRSTAPAFCSVATAAARSTAPAFCSVATTTARFAAPAFCSVTTTAARPTAPAFRSVITRKSFCSATTGKEPISVRPHLEQEVVLS